MNNYYFKIFFVFLFCTTACFAQKSRLYDLRNAKHTHKLVYDKNQSVTAINDTGFNGVSGNGIVWIKDLAFFKGTIDVDLRGKDVFQQSFLGIALGNVDTVTYEAIYFRPFNFQSKDTLRRSHTVQYISQPDYPWEKLREEHPLMYENAVTPFPLAASWFHAHIVITDEDIAVYVDHSAKASLKVKRLNKIEGGVIGLWTYGLKGDFANLKITN